MLIENFIWDLQRYVNSNTTFEEEKVFVGSLFLVGHTKTWWRLRTEDFSRPPVTDWEGFTWEIRDQFHPANSGQVTQTAMRQLKHARSI
ncbi:unnamed protein product [Spirodela intermedia]|uniref:Uncharacterized protein n=2 Tax=Spirodela intermedia TaxID=51605 RepID=A0A7I8IY53_SPIIN|nr:unnamed protein product [Spirodela intermedia]CAA6662797.1 unnamed protein product [Spirodela intermedia]CAA7399210.1 unnamed protein product [Spirodela intermedia]